MAESTDTKSKGGRPKGSKNSAPKAQPTFGLTAVDELPPETSGRSASSELVNLLSQIVDDPDLHGGWFQVAEYHTLTTARNTAKAIAEGTRRIPEAPEGMEWEFTHRKQPKPGDSKSGTSRLFVRLIPVGSNAEDADNDE